MKRALIYVIGLFILALGVAFAINSNLGVSPINSLPYVFSQVTGIKLSTCVIVVFCFYILLQILILRKEFKPINLLQILFSTIFGYFTDLTKWIVGDFVLPTYFGQVVMLFISIVLISLGILLYVEANLVPMPMEGLTLAISQKLNKPFHNVKVVVDCLVVALGIIISLIVFHRLVGIREGTIISAIVIGKIIAVLKEPLLTIIQKLQNKKC